MFKFTKTLLDRGVQKDEAPSSPPPFTQHALYEEIPEIPLGPEMTIGESVTIIGKIAFQREIHIDGVFEGELEGMGKLTVGPQGFVKADLELEEAEISGKVEGNITVKTRLTLRKNAEVRGNIIAPRLSVEEGVSIIGQVHVTSNEIIET